MLVHRRITYRTGRQDGVPTNIARHRKVVFCRSKIASFKSAPRSWVKQGRQVKCVAHNSATFIISGDKRNSARSSCGDFFDRCELVELGPVYKCSSDNKSHLCSTSQCHVLQSDGVTTICSVTGLVVPIDTLVHHIEYDDKNRSTNVPHVKVTSDQTTIKISRAMRTYISMIQIWTVAKTKEREIARQNVKYSDTAKEDLEKEKATDRILVCTIEWLVSSKFLTDIIFRAADLYRSMNLQRQKNHTKTSRKGRPYSTSIRFRLFAASYLILYLHNARGDIVNQKMGITRDNCLACVTQFILSSRIDTAKFNRSYKPYLLNESISQLTSYSQGCQYFTPLRTSSIFKTQMEILRHTNLHGLSENLLPVLL